jgi:hypothetical protein
MMFLDAEGVWWVVTADRKSPVPGHGDNGFGFVFSSGQQRRFLATWDVPASLLDSTVGRSGSDRMVEIGSDPADREKWIALLALAVPVS